MRKSHRIILNVMLLTVAGIIYYSCTKKNFDDHMGPSICPTSKFQVVTQPAISHTSINLNSQSQVLTAEFNEDVKWTVVIKGLTSKSFKKYTGYVKVINLTWKGNPDTLAFFKAEQCNAEFTVSCKETVTIPFTITTPNNFSNFNYLVYDGDGGGAAGIGPYTYGAWGTTTPTGGLNSPQGGNCLRTVGLDDSLRWFFAGYDFNPNLTSSLNTNAEQVYFNCFVNLEGNTKTIPVVTFTEGGVKRNKNISVPTTGWQYVTFKLSDANIVNPKNITAVSFGLNAFPNQAYSGSMCIDFVSFTNDSPFITIQK